MQVFNGKIKSGTESITSANPFLSHQIKGLSEMNKKIIPLNSKPTKICSVNGCERKRDARGICNKHYKALLRKGIPLPSKTPPEPLSTCSVDKCNSTHEARGFCRKHYLRWKRNGNLLLVKQKRGEGGTWEERFWSLVDKTTNSDGCWEWQGGLMSNGYGRVTFKRSRWTTHRLIWFLTYGFNSEMQILHSCDNKICINPAHLREGTIEENMQDKVDRSRQMRGEAHHLTKFSDEDVRRIVEKIKAGHSDKTLALEYGVSKRTINYIRLGRTWKHIEIK